MSGGKPETDEDLSSGQKLSFFYKTFPVIQSFIKELSYSCWSPFLFSLPCISFNEFSDHISHAKCLQLCFHCPLWESTMYLQRQLIPSLSQSLFHTLRHHINWFFLPSQLWKCKQDSRSDTFEISLSCKRLFHPSQFIWWWTEHMTLQLILSLDAVVAEGVEKEILLSCHSCEVAPKSNVAISICYKWVAKRYKCIAIQRADTQYDMMRYNMIHSQIPLNETVFTAILQQTKSNSL